MNTSKIVPYEMQRHGVRVVRAGIFNADGDAAIYPANECVLKKDREPRSRYLDLFHALQFRSHTPIAQNNARNGCGGYGQALVIRGFGARNR